MTLWEKIKDFFGFNHITLEVDREEMERLYKLEPNDETTINIKEDVVKTKTKKPRRSWYNNGKIQKLLYKSEAEKLSDEWKKGKLKKD